MIKTLHAVPHNGHKQGNEEGLQDFVFELYQEEVTIKSKFCWPELESMDCQTLFVCQRDHDNEDEGKHKVKADQGQQQGKEEVALLTERMDPYIINFFLFEWLIFSYDPPF